MFNIETLDVIFCTIGQEFSFVGLFNFHKNYFHTLNNKCGTLSLNILIRHDEHLMYYKICTIPRMIRKSVPQTKHL